MSRRAALLMVPLAAATVLGLGQTSAPAAAALSAPFIGAANLYPGWSGTDSLFGLTAGASYVLSDSAGDFSSSVTGDEQGDASAPINIPGATTATSTVFTLTESQTETVVATRTIPILPPKVTIENDTPRELSLAVEGFAPGEPLRLTYSSSIFTGPPTAVAPTSFSDPTTYNGQAISLSGGPQPLPVSFSVTVIGQTYHRSITASAIEPPGQLGPAIGMRIVTSSATGSNPAADWNLASTTGDFILSQQWGAVELEHYSAGGESFAPIAGLPVLGVGNPCVTETLTQQANGNLVALCANPGKPTTVYWSANTTGTGTGSRTILDATGHLVIESNHGVAWRSGVGLFELGAGSTLTAGQTLVSGNGYTLLVQSDGNLVLRAPNKQALWSSRTAGTGTANRLIMQTDGNLVLYSAKNKALWASGTARTGSGNFTALQTDGNLVTYTSSGKPLWDWPHGRL